MNRVSRPLENFGAFGIVVPETIPPRLGRYDVEREKSLVVDFMDILVMPFERLRRGDDGGRKAGGRLVGRDGLGDNDFDRLGENDGLNDLDGDGDRERDRLVDGDGLNDLEPKDTDADLLGFMDGLNDLEILNDGDAERDNIIDDAGESLMEEGYKRIEPPEALELSGEYIRLFTVPLSCGPTSFS